MLIVCLLFCCLCSYLSSYILLPGSVKARHASKTVNVEDFDSVISNFLRNAKDRRGGRAARKPPNTTPQEHSSDSNGGSDLEQEEED